VSHQRYTPEFKDEAVRQVAEKGQGGTEVAARLGVSIHSLYNWVKAASPNKEEKRSDELFDAKKEILKLRAELRRTQEERDILKNPQRTLQGSPNKVRLHSCPTGSVLSPAIVPGPWRRSKWVLPMEGSMGHLDTSRAFHQ
jgi:transposase